MNKQTISISEYKALAKQGRVGKARNGDKAKAQMLAVIQKQLHHYPTAKLYHGDNELKFSDDRKFKFDYAIIIPGMVDHDIKCAIEYEGLMSEKSGHTTVTGYTSNCQKYNLATCLGWKLLRYTALNHKDLESDLKKLLNNTDALPLVEVDEMEEFIPDWLKHTPVPFDMDEKATLSKKEFEDAMLNKPEAEAQTILVHMLINWAPPFRLEYDGKYITLFGRDKNHPVTHYGGWAPVEPEFEEIVLVPVVKEIRKATPEIIEVGDFSIKIKLW